jgi:hypothetical protein
MSEQDASRDPDVEAAEEASVLTEDADSTEAPAATDSPE